MQLALLQHRDAMAAHMLTVTLLLNVALFGMTAAQWRAENPGKEGNMRDHATLEQLVGVSLTKKLTQK